MIFVTVGSQVPFDRMINAVEKWAIARGRAKEIIYQIGNGVPPETGEWKRALLPEKYNQLCKKADLIVGHAGTGIWMTAAELGSRLILFPRRFATYHEHRNEHQYEMCRHVESTGAVTIAFTEEELFIYLDAPDTIKIPISNGARAEDLHHALHMLIDGKPLPPERR